MRALEGKYASGGDILEQMKWVRIVWKTKSRPFRSGFGRFGGATRDRTADLLNAIQALSQLSYDPNLACNKNPIAWAV